MTSLTIMSEANSLTVPVGQATDVYAFGLHDSPLSPWYQAKIYYRGILFTSVYQLIAYSKAKHFGFTVLSEKITATADPSQLRYLVRQIGGDESTWSPILKKVMEVGMRELLAQNFECLAALARTGTRRIAFALNGDTAWGVGLPPEDPAIRVPSIWPGRNLLGGILEDLRDKFFKEVMELYRRPVATRVIDDAARQEVIRLTESWLVHGCDLYDIDAKCGEIRFDLKGTTAGQACWKDKDGKSWIRYNPVLLSENWDDFTHQTVPHEVAHIVAMERHGDKIRAHGREWQAVMRDFWREPRRCHSYNCVNASARAGRRQVFRCQCAAHVIGVNPDATRLCQKCRKELVFMADEEALLATGA